MIRGGYSLNRRYTLLLNDVIELEGGKEAVGNYIQYKVGKYKITIIDNLKNIEYCIKDMIDYNLMFN